MELSLSCSALNWKHYFNVFEFLCFCSTLSSCWKLAVVIACKRYNLITDIENLVLVSSTVCSNVNIIAQLKPL
jgi:hypothetical protein